MMYKRKLLSATALLLVTGILASCNGNTATSSNVSVAGSAVDSSSSKVSSNSILNFISSAEDDSSNSSTSSAVGKSVHPGRVIADPIQITEMSQKEIFKHLNETGKLVLPETVEFKKGSIIEYVYRHNGDIHEGFERYIDHKLISYINDLEAQTVLSFLKETSGWNEGNSKIIIFGGEIKEIINNYPSDAYEFYYHTYSSTVSWSSYRLGVLIMKDEQTGKNKMIVEGWTNNPTFKNGVVTIK